MIAAPPHRVITLAERVHGHDPSTRGHEPAGALVDGLEVADQPEERLLSLTLIGRMDVLADSPADERIHLSCE
jgi:hypothetical protein